MSLEKVCDSCGDSSMSGERHHHHVTKEDTKGGVRESCGGHPRKIGELGEMASYHVLPHLPVIQPVRDMAHDLHCVHR